MHTGLVPGDGHGHVGGYSAHDVTDDPVHLLVIVMDHPAPLLAPAAGVVVLLTRSMMMIVTMMMVTIIMLVMMMVFLLSMVVMVMIMLVVMIMLMVMVIQWGNRRKRLRLSLG